MAQENRAQIKTYFETGDVPTETQFANSFDSQVFWLDDVETTLGTTDTKVPTSKAVNDTIVYTKDSNGNVFYKGVTATLGAGSVRNTFQARATGNALGVTSNHNNFEQEAQNFTFGDNLRNVTIKTGAVGANYTASPDFDFLYNLNYSSEIFRNPENTANYHRYYDPTNDRIVLTNLTTLVISYIGSSGSGLNLEVNGTPNGDQTLLNLIEGTNIDIADNGTGGVTISSLADRYKTTSTSSILIGNGSRTFTVDANLAYIPLQEVLIVYDASNHMHGTITSYSGTTLIVDVKNHTGGGTYASWVINLDGVPVDAITGSGTVNRLAYFTAAQVIDDAAAITAARALISDANGIPTHSATTSTELGYVSGVTSGIQSQIDTARRGTILFPPSTINPVDNTTYYFSTGLFFSTTQTDVDINLGYAFKVIGAVISVSNNAGTAGSNEDSTLSLRNTTAGTSSTIGTFKTSVASNAQYEKTITGLNISVASTDSFALQWAFPAPNPNPTNVFLRITLIVEFT